MSISNFEYKKMSVTCLGPVHITDEVGTVYSYQYLYDAGSRRVYFLNERLWVKFLYKHNLLAEFEELIKTRLRAGTLCEWVQEKGFKIEDLGDAVTDYAGVEVVPEILAANKMRLTEIVRTVHNVEGQPYIPGSSIKGALRTGLLFSLLLQEDRLRNAAWAEVSRIINDNRLRDKNSAFARLAQKLEIVLLHRLKIPKNEYSAELMPQASMNCSIIRIMTYGLRRSWKWLLPCIGGILLLMLYGNICITCLNCETISKLQRKVMKKKRLIMRTRCWKRQNLNRR